MRNIRISAGLLSLLVLLSSSFAPSEAADLKLAVFLENRTSEEYESVVSGLSDMLVMSLKQEKRLTVVERAQLEEGVKILHLDPREPITTEEVVRLGGFLGADVMVVGSFTIEEDQDDAKRLYRIDAKLIDIRERKLLAEQRVERRVSQLSKKDKDSEMMSELGGVLLRSLSKFRMTTKKVAVLDFENRTSEKYESFVRAIPDMLMTSMGQSADLTIIERVQIKKAMKNFSIEQTGVIDTEKAVEIGQWLGADAIVLGSFVQFGEVFRIDARLIEAKTGELLVGQDVKGGEGDVITMVDQLGAKLIASFGEKEEEDKGGTGFLRVRFRFSKASMTERAVYTHICKLVVDSVNMGMSPVVGKIDEWVTLFSKDLEAGKHNVEVIHGFVQEGEWDGEMPEQPKVFQVIIEPGSTVTIQYAFEVGWFSDQYYYKPPWKGAPR